jgi:hypothetical protein
MNLLINLMIWQGTVGEISMKNGKIPDNDFLTEYLTGFGSTRGCALLGKTAFNKLEAVRNFLSERGFVELGGEGEADERFVVIDCPKETQDADSVRACLISLQVPCQLL